MLTAPIHHHLALTAQDVLTFGSWGITFILLAVAVELGRRERTPFYVLVVLAAMVAAFAEPLYDEAFMLYFYSTHGMQTFFTAFHVPQPVWTHSGYAVLYALPAVFIARQIRLGTLTQRGLYVWAGVVLLMSCAFEMIGINLGTYTYWGPHELRILHYPLVIGALESAQVMCFAVGAALLRDRVKGPVGLLGLFILFPCTFFMANFGAGAPTIIAIHLKGTTPLLVTLMSLLSIGFAAALIRGAASLLPRAAGEPQRAPAARPEIGLAAAS